MAKMLGSTEVTLDVKLLKHNQDTSVYSLAKGLSIKKDHFFAILKDSYSKVPNKRVDQISV